MTVESVRSMDELGRAVRHFRRSAGLTQLQLAEMAAVSARWLSSLEKGRTPGAEFSKVLQVLKALNVEMLLEPLPVYSEEDRALLELIEQLREF
ncbi:helix-turn-helix domain-containing protein [Micropruina sp.]|uniref:helix-turn-helix domain-containing protein n=1 Tax=Micropruina sp. TaxID=2737536 RepID=UPI0039E6D30E